MTTLFYVITGNDTGDITVVCCVNEMELAAHLATLPAGLEPVLRLCEDMSSRLLVIEGRPRFVRSVQNPAYCLGGLDC
ncbi:MAG: hypothetical protein R2932_59085 [Caldilineaceae bacterium]